MQPADTLCLFLDKAVSKGGGAEPAGILIGCHTQGDRRSRATVVSVVTRTVGRAVVAAAVIAGEATVVKLL